MMAIVLVAAEFTGQGPNIDRRAQQQAFPTASVANSQRCQQPACWGRRVLTMDAANFSDVSCVEPTACGLCVLDCCGIGGLCVMRCCLCVINWLSTHIFKSLHGGICSELQGWYEIRTGQREVHRRQEDLAKSTIKQTQPTSHARQRGNSCACRRQQS